MSGETPGALAGRGARFLALFVPLAAALPLFTAYAWYRVGLLAFKQVGWARALGLLGVAGWVLVPVVAALAWALVATGQDRAAPPVRRAARLAFFVGALANLLLVGIAMFHWSPRLAPAHVTITAAAVWMVLAFRFWRFGDAEQRLVAAALTAIGWALLATPVALGPWIVGAWMKHAVRLPIAVAPPPAAAARPSAPRRVVLVTFDALRARSTSLLDPARDHTPALAALARESHWFAECRATADGTLISVPTILSGLSPSGFVPGIANESGFLSHGAIYGLAGMLRPAGYRAYYATMYLNPAVLGMTSEYAGGAFRTRGFFSDEFNTASFLPLKEAFAWTFGRISGDAPREIGGGGGRQPLGVRQVFEDARAYLKGEAGRAFVWVHVGAPHLPYYDIPPHRADEPIDPERFPRVGLTEVARPDTAVARRIEPIYERYVRFADQELGHFLAALRRDGMWDDSLVVVTSDHGEEFLPDRIGHGDGILRNDTTHVPLVVHLPGQRQGRRHEGRVGLVDVAPTVLEAVYEAAPPGLTGQSALRPARPERVLFSYGLVKTVKHRTVPQSIAAYQGAYKYVTRFDHDQAIFCRADEEPEAARDLAAEQPERHELLRHLVAAERARFEPPEPLKPAR